MPNLPQPPASGGARGTPPGCRRAGLPASMLALLFALVTSACSVSPVARVPVADPTNPLELNEAAVASAARGDIDVAWLLLERAARLAPHDTRIAANLAALRDFRGRTPRGPIVTMASDMAAPLPPTGQTRSRP